MAFDKYGTLLAVSSSGGTVHLFKLNEDNRMNNNSGSGSLVSTKVEEEDGNKGIGNGITSNSSSSSSGGSGGNIISRRFLFGASNRGPPRSYAKVRIRPIGPNIVALFNGGGGDSGSVDDYDDALPNNESVILIVAAYQDLGKGTTGFIPLKSNNNNSIHDNNNNHNNNNSIETNNGNNNNDKNDQDNLMRFVVDNNGRVVPIPIGKGCWCHSLCH